VLDEKYSKGSRRDAAQVLANGGIAGIFVLFHVVYPLQGWPWLGAAAALAAANADTWATELGVLSSKPPRLITTGKPVEYGDSGAVSTAGLLAATGGSLLIAALAAAFDPFGVMNSTWASGAVAIILMTLAGFAGSLVDSWLGATRQAIFYCPVCRKETERHPLHTCGTPTTLLRGWSWLNNDWVNLACTVSAVMLALGFSFVTPAGSGIWDKGGMMTDMQLSTTAFENGQPIPKMYSCDGANLSPALAWSGVPAGTQSLALVVEDPDAPSGIFTHWVIYNIPTDRDKLSQGVVKTETVNGGSVQGTNDFRKLGYDGPCPPRGSKHRYYFTLYALDLPANLPPGYGRVQLLSLTHTHVLAQAQWMGTYQR
jgi:Raf kinase inhibitor-like YbhB/YbcL family protein